MSGFKLPPSISHLILSKFYALDAIAIFIYKQTGSQIPASSEVSELMAGVSG